MKTVFVIFSIIMVTHFCYGQRHLEKSGMVEFSSGAIDQLSSPFGKDPAWAARILLGKIMNERWMWRTGVTYTDRTFSRHQYQIPVEQFLGTFAMHRVLWSPYTKSLFLSVAASAHVGYESVNRQDTRLDVATTIQSESGLLYGVGGRLLLEVFLSNRFALLLGAEKRWLPSSDISPFDDYYTLGLQINLEKLTR